MSQHKKMRINKIHQKTQELVADAAFWSPVLTVWLHRLRNGLINNKQSLLLKASWSFAMLPSGIKKKSLQVLWMWCNNKNTMTVMIKVLIVNVKFIMLKSSERQQMTVMDYTSVIVFEYSWSLCMWEQVLYDDWQNSKSSKCIGFPQSLFYSLM